nr:hypothetical protein P5626_16380 [Bacillus subtilis]
MCRFYLSLSLPHSSMRPLILTALGGVFSERSGVVNIGLEGLMIIGAFTSVLFNLFLGPELGAAAPWLSLLAAMAAGSPVFTDSRGSGDFVSRRPDSQRCRH